MWTASWPQAALAQDLVITNARILDGTGRVIDRGSVVITAGRIASVSAGTAAAPRGARVIDVLGRTVLPGFTEAHRHIIRGDGAQWLKEQAAARMQEFLEAGFTTVASAGDQPEAILELRRRRRSSPRSRLLSCRCSPVWAPKEVQGPDPTGITVLNQGWELCSAIGTLVTCSVGHPADAFVRLPASQWTDGAKHHWPGTGGGTNDRRDSPRHVRLMETGQIDMKALVARTYPLSQTRQAYQDAADRTVVATVVTPNA